MGLIENILKSIATTHGGGVDNSGKYHADAGYQRYGFKGSGTNPPPVAQTPYERMKQMPPMPASAYPTPAPLTPSVSTSDSISGFVPGGEQPQIHRNTGVMGPRSTGQAPQLTPGIPDDLGISGGADVGYNPQSIDMAGPQPDLPSHSPIFDMMQPLMAQAPMSQGQDVAGSVPTHKSGLLKALLHRMF